MNAREAFVNLVKETNEMQHILQLMEDEPVRIFTTICEEYERTQKPVSDHNVRRSTYLQDIALKALASAGLVEQESGGRISLYQFKPTEKGLAQYHKLIEDKDSEEK